MIMMQRGEKAERRRKEMQVQREVGVEKFMGWMFGGGSAWLVSVSNV
jgi:hypothetical protein